jgi:hypothetical protein
MKPRAIRATDGEACAQSRFMRFAMRELSRGYAGEAASSTVHEAFRPIRRRDDAFAARTGAWEQAARDA